MYGNLIHDNSNDEDKKIIIPAVYAAIPLCEFKHNSDLIKKFGEIYKIIDGAVDIMVKRYPNETHERFRDCIMHDAHVLQVRGVASNMIIKELFK